MKDKFIFFVIGLLLGTIISTSAFYVYSKSINTQTPMNNGNSPSISSDSSNDFNQPPDMPSNDSNQSNDQSSGGNNNSGGSHSSPYIEGVHNITVPVGTDFNTMVSKLISGVHGSGYVSVDYSSVNLNSPGKYTVTFSSDDGVTKTATVTVTN